jgi:hypothetical protein
MTTPIAASTIAGQAFRLMELGPISSFGDDTPQARDAAEQYPIALESCLAACDWSFASRLAFLPGALPGPQVATDPDLPHLYILPGDCLIVREVGDLCTRWRVDIDGLRADQPALLRLRYTARITNEAQLPAEFQKAVAAELAFLLAPVHLGTQNKINSLEQRAGKTLKKAMREHSRAASESRYDGLEDQGDWVAEARR